MVRAHNVPNRIGITGKQQEAEHRPLWHAIIIKEQQDLKDARNAYLRRPTFQIRFKPSISVIVMAYRFSRQSTGILWSTVSKTAVVAQQKQHV